MDHDHLESALRAESESRLERERGRIVELEASRPLRRPILESLADYWPRLPGLAELTDSVRLAGIPRAEIIAALAEMEDECVIHSGVVDGDTRWAMTMWGRSEYGAHLAFGAKPAPPDPPTPKEVEAFLEEALDWVLFQVLPAQGAEEAAGRMREIADQARAAHLESLASRAEAALSGLS